ncbi:hypothetical protein RB600_001643 [Gaeumannomyces tritici]
MASHEPDTSTVTVGDIASMSDAALAVFIQKNRGPDGVFDLPVDGWDKLLKDERDQLAERLTRTLAQNPAAHSRPLDLDQLDARLREASSGGTNARSRSSRSPTPTGPEFEEWALQRSRENEAEAYDKLVKDGGRPLYPIDLLDDVSASFPRGPIGAAHYVPGNPDKYRELLRPWLDNIGEGYYFRSWRGGGTSSEDPWEVFQKQWERWVMFRRWQRDNRDLEDDDDGGFPAYLEAQKRYLKRYYSERVAEKKLAELESDPSSYKKSREGKQERRQWQRHYCRESGVTGPEFSDYVDAVKRRLARHGFTRPFELNQDPKQQGKLETWIEYLGFECWWLDLFTRAIERRQEHHDKEWQKLKDTGVLRPDETAEYIRTEECAMRRQSEKDRARAAVERSEKNAERIYAETQLHPHRLRIAEAERRRRLQQGTQDMLTARSRLERLKKRSDLIRGFKLSTDGLETAKRDAARHRILIQWILDQIPLIEAELSQSEKAGLDGTKASKRTKRMLDSDGDSPQQTGIKNRRLSPRLSDGAVVLNSITQQTQVPLAVNSEQAPPRDEQRRSRAGRPCAGPSSRTRATREAAPQGERPSARISERLAPTLSVQTSGRATRPRKRVEPATRSPSGRDDARRRRSARTAAARSPSASAMASELRKSVRIAALPRVNYRT